MIIPLEPCAAGAGAASIGESPKPEPDPLGPPVRSFESLRQLIPSLDGPITNRRLRELTYMSRQGVGLVLAEMVQEGKLLKLGRGRGVVYHQPVASSMRPGEEQPTAPQPPASLLPPVNPPQLETPPRPLARSSAPDFVSTPPTHPDKEPGALSRLLQQSPLITSARATDRKGSGARPAGGSPALLALVERREQARKRILTIVSEVETVRALTTTVPLPRRTLQRVLSAMLKEQVLMAEGATRRRRYFLPVESNPRPTLGA